MYNVQTEVPMQAAENDIAIKKKMVNKYRILWVVYGVPCLASLIMLATDYPIPGWFRWMLVLTNVLSLILLVVFSVKDIGKWVRGEIKLSVWKE